MQLSEAIRLGAMIKGQSFGVLRIGNQYYQASCALGAALDAIGVVKIGYIQAFKVLHKMFPILRAQVTDPNNPKSSDNCRYLVMCLNDKYEWSREKIADWVEEQERRLGYWPTEQKGDQDERGTSQGQTSDQSVDSCAVHG